MHEETIEDLSMLALTIGFTGVALLNHNRIVSLVCLAATATSFAVWVWRRADIAYRSMPKSTPTTTPRPPVTPQTWKYTESPYIPYEDTALYVISREISRLHTTHNYYQDFTVEFSGAAFHGYFMRSDGITYLRLWCDDSGFTDYGEHTEYFDVYPNLKGIIHYITMHIFFG